MTVVPCPVCGCGEATGAHAVVARLALDDMDAAIDAGLLEATPCPGCAVDCTTMLVTARDARHIALAARERYRARNARLERRAAQRAAARVARSSAGPASAPALPTAAADALRRALERAKGRPS